MMKVTPSTASKKKKKGISKIWALIMLHITACTINGVTSAKTHIQYCTVLAVRSLMWV